MGIAEVDNNFLAKLVARRQLVGTAQQQVALACRGVATFGHRHIACQEGIAVGTHFQLCCHIEQTLHSLGGSLVAHHLVGQVVAASAHTLNGSVKAGGPERQC